jgi:hypothetical protein
MDLGEHPANVEGKAPLRIVRLEATYIANPPDVIADAIVFDIGPVHRASSQLLAQRDGFKHRTVGVARASDIIDLSVARRLEEAPEEKMTSLFWLTHEPLPMRSEADSLSRRIKRIAA